MTARDFGLVTLAVCGGILAARVVEWGWEHYTGITLFVIGGLALAWAVPYYLRENQAAGKDHPRSNGGRLGR